jgi:hypothetical protein
VEAARDLVPTGSTGASASPRETNIYRLDL